VPVLATDHISINTNGSGGVVINSVGSTVTDARAGYGLIIDKYKVVGQGIVGICFLISLVSLIFYITKLAAASDNMLLRQKAVNGIVFSGIALAIFGSLPFGIAVCFSFFL